MKHVCGFRIQFWQAKSPIFAGFNFLCRRRFSAIQPLPNRFRRRSLLGAPVRSGGVKASGLQQEVPKLGPFGDGWNPTPSIVILGMVYGRSTTLPIVIAKHHHKSW